jgi:hypothetical protein
MVTWEWIEDQNEPYPDFNIHSQCVDYSAFTRWMEREQISREVIKGYTVKWDGGRGRNGGKGGKTRERIQEFTKTISMEEHMGHGEPGYSSHGLN